jgi:hypothetical protein
MPRNRRSVGGSLPPILYPLFWDCRPQSIDAGAQAPFVLDRVLEYGSLASARWALETYGAEHIKGFLRQRGLRTLSRKTLGFWTMLLGLEGEACFDRSSLSHSKSFWNY